MRTSRFLMAALTAGLLSSTVAFAAPPTADQVSVPYGTDMGHRRHEGRLKALFQAPEELMMFRMQMRESVRNMPRDQRKAYKKSEFQRIRAMSDSEKAAWRKDLDAKWAALSPETQQRYESKLQRHQARHEQHQQRRHGQSEDMAQPQQ